MTSRLRVTNVDGSRDPGFAPGGPYGDGVQTIDYLNGPDTARAIALEPTGAS